MSALIFYLVVVSALNIEADRPIIFLVNFLEKIDGGKVAHSLKVLWESPAWERMAVVGERIINEFMKAW